MDRDEVMKQMQEHFKKNQNKPFKRIILGCDLVSDKVDLSAFLIKDEVVESIAITNPCVEVNKNNLIIDVEDYEDLPK